MSKEVFFYCFVCNKRVKGTPKYWYISVELQDSFGICEDCYNSLKEKYKRLVVSEEQYRDLFGGL